MWYAFEAYNQERLHGWTQNPEVARVTLWNLNAGRPEENHYGLVELGNGEDVTDDQGQRLMDRNDEIFNDDTTVDDVLVQEFSDPAEAASHDHQAAQAATAHSKWWKPLG